MSLENRQSHTLFGVAALFLSGHLLRVILNLHELVHGLHSRLTAHDEDGCGEMPVNFPPWALVSKFHLKSVIVFLKMVGHDYTKNQFETNVAYAVTHDTIILV